MEAVLFFGGLSAGIIAGASVMALAYLQVMKSNQDPKEAKKVDYVKRELNRCSKMHNVLIIDGHEKIINRGGLYK